MDHWIVPLYTYVHILTVSNGPITDPTQLESEIKNISYDGGGIATDVNVFTHKEGFRNSGYPQGRVATRWTLYSLVCHRCEQRQDNLIETLNHASHLTCSHLSLPTDTQQQACCDPSFHNRMCDKPFPSHQSLDDSCGIYWTELM